jgi:transcription elongation factor Elf1
MLTVDRLTDIETMLPHLMCPMCYRGGLEAVLRCDLSPRSDCLATIHCTRCGYSFEPEAGQRASDVVQAKILAGDIKAACPACGGLDSRVEFRCSVADQRCCYFLTCRSCGEIHQLYA